MSSALVAGGHLSDQAAPHPTELGVLIPCVHKLSLGGVHKLV
jgi:hypothetical protein